MKKLILLAVFMSVVSVFMSCISIPVRVVERTNENTALVYGCFDIRGNRNVQDMNWMSILQFSPPTEKPYWSAAMKNGVFYNQNMGPGQYCISSFGSDSKTYRISAEMGCFEIEKADLYYFGSYEMVWSGGKPKSLKRAFSPSEADVIEKILEMTDPGTYWDAKLRKRLTVLREAEIRKANIPRAPSLR